MTEPAGTDPSTRLRELAVIAPGAAFVAFVCTGCGAEFQGSPSMARFLAGSRGDPDTPGLCWVCRRSKATVAAEEKALRAYYAEIEKYWTE